MRKFTTTECEDFLRKVDGELTKSCEIVVIGGGAVALKYKGTHTTTDLDLWSVIVRGGKESVFWEAVERARTTASSPVPIQKATVAQPPHSFEDRLIPHPIDGLRRIKVSIPEAHDLALMKIARGEAHDLDAIEDIHAAAPMELETLVGRYEETLPQVLGSKEMHRLNFLAAVSRLFGDDAAQAVDGRTAALLQRSK